MEQRKGAAFYPLPLKLRTVIENSAPSAMRKSPICGIISLTESVPLNLNLNDLELYLNPTFLYVSQLGFADPILTIVELYGRPLLLLTESLKRKEMMRCREDNGR